MEWKKVTVKGKNTVMSCHRYVTNNTHLKIRKIAAFCHGAPRSHHVMN